MSLRTPTIYRVIRDKIEPERYFFIVMEDLSNEYEPLNQTVGISYDQQYQIVSDCAQFHSQFWEPTTSYNPFDETWLDNGGKPWFSPWFDGLVANGDVTWPQVCDIYNNHPATPNILGDDAKAQAYMRSLTDLVIENRKEIVSRLYEVLASRPMTLVHGDMRSDNIFKRKGANEFAYVSYQSCQYMYASSA